MIFPFYVNSLSLSPLSPSSVLLFFSVCEMFLIRITRGERETELQDSFSHGLQRC